MMELVKGVNMSDAAIGGAVSGCLTRAILSPVDVVKIRFQLQLEPIRVSVLSDNKSPTYHRHFL